MSAISPETAYFHAMWMLVRGGAAQPTPEETRVYRQASVLHGFSSHEQDKGKLEAILLLALSRTLGKAVEGTHPLQALYPVYFFIPDNHWDWAKQHILQLSATAKQNNPVTDEVFKDVKWNLFKNTLRQLKKEARPWLVEKEPERWFAFGFDRDAKFLPPWFSEKLSHI